MLERYDIKQLPDCLADKKFLCLQCLHNGQNGTFLYQEPGCEKCKRIKFNLIRSGLDFEPLTDVLSKIFSVNLGIDILNILIDKYCWEQVPFNDKKEELISSVGDLLSKKFDDLSTDEKEGLKQIYEKSLTNESLASITKYYVDSYNEGCLIGLENLKTISYISVRDLFGYHSYDLTMNDESLSIIIGTNGLGKTTIFRVLKSILIQGDSWHENYKKLEYVLSIPFSSFVVGFRDGTKIELKQENETQKQKVLLLNLNEENRYIKFKKDQKFEEILKDIDNDNILNNEEFELIFPPQVYQTDFINETENIISIYNKIRKLFPKLKVLKERFLFIETKRITLDKLCEEIKSLEKCKENEEKFNKLSNAFTSFYYEKDPSLKKLELNENNELIVRTSTDQTIDVNCLSSGEKGALQILFDVIFNSGKNAIILIDEPEISLHIAWQQQIAEIITEISEERDGSQIIIATHSPFMASANEDSIVEASLV